jgi:hypothetical protein
MIIMHALCDRIFCKGLLSERKYAAYWLLYLVVRLNLFSIDAGAFSARECELVGTLG